MVHKLVKRLNSRPCESCLADICPSESLTICFFRVKKIDFKSAEVQKSTKEFSHDLDLMSDASGYVSGLLSSYLDILIVAMQVCLHKIGAHLLGKLTICIDNAGLRGGLRGCLRGPALYQSAPF